MWNEQSLKLIFSQNEKEIQSRFPADASSDDEEIKYHRGKESTEDEDDDTARNYLRTKRRPRTETGAPQLNQVQSRRLEHFFFHNHPKAIMRGIIERHGGSCHVDTITKLLMIVNG